MSQGSGILVAIALWSAIAVFLLSLLLFAVIVGVRWNHGRRVRWRETVRARWREILTRAVVEKPERVPQPTPAEAREVLAQWAYFQEFLAGNCHENLSHLARLAGLDLEAKRFLKSRSTRLRLLGIQALGSLRDREYRALLWPIARAENSYESLAAAHALLRISPRESIDELVSLIAARPDWPPARVMAMLGEAGSEVVSEPLARAVVEADDAYRPLLVIYLENAEDEVALAAIRQILPDTHDQQVIATCLYVLRHIVHPASLAILREYLSHPNWILQLHAVTGIGRLGNEEDVADLIRMLRHKRFWVRYRAAQALQRLPTVGTERLRRIEATQEDRYARDILRQVITERAA